MVGGKHDSLRIDRRTALKLAAGAGLAATSALQMPRAARADNTTLSIWTGYPELVPYYQAVADAYAKTKPGVTCTILSTSRELAPSAMRTPISCVRCATANDSTP